MHRKSKLARIFRSPAAANAERLAKRSIELHHEGEFDAADKALRESLRLSPPVHLPSPPDYSLKRISWETDEDADPAAGAILNVLNFAWEASSERKPFASYYDLPIAGSGVKGQRDPGVRLGLIPTNLSGKSVIDIGCNFGGMLFSIKEPLKWAVGVDFDRRLVNAANRIAHHEAKDIRFYTFNLQTDPTDLLRDLMPEPVVDVAFFLSVCAHLDNWSEVIAALPTIARSVLFEANGEEHEQLGQIRQLHRSFDQVTLLADKGAPGIDSRRLFWCEKVRASA